MYDYESSPYIYKAQIFEEDFKQERADRERLNEKLRNSKNATKMQYMIERWEEEKEQMLVQIRAYKRQSDELKRQMIAIQDEAESDKKYSDDKVGLQETINNLESKVIVEIMFLF